MAPSSMFPQFQDGASAAWLPAPLGDGAKDVVSVPGRKLKCGTVRAFGRTHWCACGKRTSLLGALGAKVGEHGARLSGQVLRVTR